MIGDAVFSMLAKLLYLLTRIGLPPLILAHITLGQYGLWSVCFIVVGYLGLADLGFSSLYVRSAARLHAAGDTAGIGALLSTGVLFMGLLSVLLWLGLWCALPALLPALQVAPAQHGPAAVLLLGASAVFLCDLSLSAFAYVLHGLQRYRAEQRVWVAAYLLEMVLLYLMFGAGWGLLSLLYAFALRYAVSIGCNVCQVYRALPGLALGPRHCRWSLLRHFLGHGLGLQASSCCAMALHSADRVLAGLLLGPQAVALFDLGGKLPVSAASVPAAITQLTLPAAARLAARHAGAQAYAELHGQHTRALCLAAAVPLSFLACYAAPLCLAWLGPRPEQPLLAQLMLCASCGAWLHICTGPGTALLRGRGGVAHEFLYHGLRVAAIALALALVWRGGDAAALAAALLGAAAAAGLVYLCWLQRRLGLPLRALLARALGPAALLWCVGVALERLWQAAVTPAAGRWALLAQLGAAAALHGMLCAGAIWLLLGPAERAMLRAWLPWRRRRSDSGSPA
jgi:O-antigen/teichoic acid export membrane protein